jgi:hypothetical protein
MGLDGEITRMGGIIKESVWEEKGHFCFSLQTFLLPGKILLSHEKYLLYAHNKKGNMHCNLER